MHQLVLLILFWICIAVAHPTLKIINKIQIPGSDNTDGVSIAAVHENFGYFANSTGSLFKYRLPQFNLEGVVDIDDLPYITFVHNGHLFIFGFKSVLYQIGLADFQLISSVNLSTQIPEQWGGGYALDRRRGYVYLTGEYAVLQVNLQTIPPTSMQTLVLSTTGQEPLCGTMVGDSHAYFGASVSRYSGDGVVFRVDVSNPANISLSGTAILPGKFWPFAVAESTPSILLAFSTQAVSTLVLSPSFEYSNDSISPPANLSELACFAPEIHVGFLLCGETWQQWDLQTVNVVATVPIAVDKGSRHACAIDTAMQVVYLGASIGGAATILAVSFTT